MSDTRGSIENRGFGAEVISSNVQGENKATLKMMPSLATTTVAVDGMTCGACTAAVEEGFKGVQGVSSFTVSLMTERAVVVYDPNLLSTERIAEMYVNHAPQLNGSKPIIGIELRVVALVRTFYPQPFRTRKSETFA